MEWNKGFVSFASTREIRDGKGSPHGGIYFGLGSLPHEAFEKIALGRFPNWKYKALDLSEMPRIFKAGKPLEVGPVVEYFDGGIVVNEKLGTAVEGLYAAGECTLGPFGSNRVCSAITEMLVHGADAGQNAGAYAKNTALAELPAQALQALQEKAEQSLHLKDGNKPAQIRRQVQEMAHKNLSPIRTQGELSSFLSFLDKTIQDDLPHLATASKNRAYNKEWVDAIELKNILHLLKCATISALHRTESRGVHFREDFPHTDNDHWLKENIIRFDKGVLEVDRRPVTTASMTPPKGKLPYLDMLKKMMESRSDIGGHH